MTDMVLAGCTKRITLYFNVPNERKPRKITLWPPTAEQPRRINRCPRAIWNPLLAKKGSPRDDGQDALAPLEEYLIEGLVWEIHPETAQVIHDGRRPHMSPLGPEAGENTHVPREPNVEPLTAGQREVLDRVPVPTAEEGFIDSGAIKPPAVPPTPQKIPGTVDPAALGG